MIASTGKPGDRCQAFELLYQLSQVLALQRQCSGPANQVHFWVTLLVIVMHRVSLFVAGDVAAAGFEQNFVS